MELGDDNLNRLLTGTSSAGYYAGAQMSWSYDPFGDRTSEIVGGTVAAPMPSTSTASYTAASNQVSSVNGGAGLSYDAAGDVTQDPLNSYLYDAEGRLCAAKTAGPSLTGYIYDADGIRVAKGSLTSFSCNFATNGFTPTTSYVLGPGGEQVTEYALSGPAGNYASTWQHTNAFSGGHLQATYHDTGTYFYLGDWLGTKRVEVGTNSNGNGIGCAAAFTSLPYGDGLTTVPLPGYAACSDATEHHFTGKERDAESGNDYFEARYYASSVGRFMSPDWSAKEEPVPYAKMDDPQTLNLYAYLMNNPLAGVDSDGHCPPGVDGANCNNVKVTAQVTTPAKVLDQAHLVDADGKPQGPSISGVAGGITLTVTENGKPIKGVSASETNTITATEDGKPISNTHQDTTYTTKKDGKIPDTVGLVLPTPTKKEGDAIAAEFSSYPIRVIDSQRLILQVPRVGSCSYSDVRTLQNFGADSRIVAPFSLTTTQPQPAQ